jgi:putative endonuclease
MGAWVYILHCADGSYYTGLTRAESPSRRLSEHELKCDRKAYTASRLPVRIVFAEYFELVTDAIVHERRIKGWSRVKKEALIAREFDRLPGLSRNRQTRDNGPA